MFYLYAHKEGFGPRNAYFIPSIALVSSDSSRILNNLRYRSAEKVGEVDIKKPIDLCIGTIISNPNIEKILTGEKIQDNILEFRATLRRGESPVYSGLNHFKYLIGTLTKEEEEKILDGEFNFQTMDRKILPGEAGAQIFPLDEGHIVGNIDINSRLLLGNLSDVSEAMSKFRIEYLEE